MPEGVAVALIAAAQAVTLTLLGIISARFGKVRRGVAAVRDQVENDHDTNLREENDSRHKAIWNRLDLILRRLVSGDERMGRMEKILIRHDADIDALEDTLQPRKKE